MSRNLLLSAAVIISAGLGFLAHHASAQAAKPAIYTAAQANAGANVYSQSCAVCHGASLEGVAAPALKGEAFGEMASAQDLTVSSLLDVVCTTMPQSDPGSLKPDECNAVVAYILQQNGYPAGTTALAPTDDQLKNVKVSP